jgi:HEAT repeat protein
MRAWILRVVVALTLALATTSAAARAEVPAPPLTLAPGADGGLELRAGAAVVARVPLKTPPLRRGTPRLRALDVDGHRVAEVRVPVRGTAAEEVWIGELRVRDVHVVWSGLAGPRDADGEVSIAVEVTPDEVLESQTAAQVTRCDGAPVRLFPRAYDFDAGRFRPIVSPLPPAAHETLVGRRGDPAMPQGRPVAVFHFTAASTTASAGSDARELEAPTAVDDGDPATAWMESLGGDGRGEFLTARAGMGGATVRGLRIIPGDAASAVRYHARNRVRRLQLSLGPRDDQRFDVELPETPADAGRYAEPYWVALPRPTPAACMTVVITEVTPGSEAHPPRSFGTTAISELAVFTELDGPGGAARMVADVAAAPDCASRVPALVGLGASAVAPTAEAVMAAVAHGTPRACLVEALTALEPAPREPLVVEALVAAVRGASEKEERLVTAALGRAAKPPVEALAAIVNGSMVDADRVRAARVLGALDDAAAATALLAAVGSGPESVRDAIVLACAGAPRLDVSAVLAALEGARTQSQTRRVDLLRVAPAVIKRTPDATSRALGVLRAEIAPGRPFEVRGHAVVALGALGAAALPDLALVRAHDDEPVLRHLAARELAVIGGDDALVALRAALVDGDPRVRQTAAEGLGVDRDASAGPALIAGAKQEPWPFVRRAEVEALGRLCGAGASDLLARAVERDVTDVRRAALVGLAHCKDPRASTLLLRVLGRRNEASTLRELAASLLGDLDARAVAPGMAAALARQVNESEEDLSVEGVAQATLRALGHLGGPAATTAAVTLARDARHPFQTTAVEVLGTLCDPGAGAATLRALEAGAPGPVATAAQSATKRCASRP